MTSVKLHELSGTGYELFHDFESFLDELTNQEITSVEGGFFLSGFGFGHGYFNSKFGSHNGYFGGYGGYGSYSGGYSGYSGHSGYGFGYK